MSHPKASFPGTVWDGLSANPFRRDRYHESPPDHRDWDRVVSEVIAMQAAPSIAGTAAGVTGQVLPLLDRSVIADGAAQLASARKSILYRNSPTKPAGAWTFAFWCRITRTAASGTQVYELASLGWGSGGGDQFDFRWTSNPQAPYVKNWTGSVTLFYGHDTTFSSVVVANVWSGNWHLIVGKYDGTNFGLSIDGAPFVTGSAGTTPTVTTGPLIFGADGTAASPGFAASASYDSAGWWSRAFTDADALALFNNGSGYTYATSPPSLQAGLLSWWDFGNVANLGLDRLGVNNLTAQSGPMRVVGASGTRILAGNTPNGQPYEIGIPLNAAAPVPLVIYGHPYGEDQTRWRSDAQLRVQGTAAALLASGYAIACGNHFGNHWGNPSAVEDMAELYRIAARTVPVSRVGILCESMGGTTLSLIQSRHVPNIRGWYGICPVTNLANMHTTGFSSSMDAAYLATGVGTNTFANASVGSDPLLAPSWPPVHFRFRTSPGDSTVSATANTEALKAILDASVPAVLESEYIAGTGDHLDHSNYDPDDVLAFFERAI